MKARPLKVSIGLPVHNGSDFIGTCIDSLLAQTFSGFELLIQDNASTDVTADICREYEMNDERIRYVRNERNVGAAENFNLVFHRARGLYFKWAGHDDICAPRFLEKCVEVLDNDPSIALCTGHTELINEDRSLVRYDERARCYVTKEGVRVGRLDKPHRAEGEKPAERYWDVLVHTMRTFEIFGLIRTDVLRKTVLMEGYYGSDKVLLAEVSLHGRFRILPETLLYRRCHRNQSSRLKRSNRSIWIGSRAENFMSVRIRKLIPGYFRVVQRSPIGFRQRLGCYWAIAYRFIAPETWRKELTPTRYSDG